MEALTARLRLLIRWWGSRPAATRDREFACVLTLLAFTAPLSQLGAQFGDLPRHGASVASVLLTLGQTLPMAIRTRWPAACLAVTGISFAVHECLGCPPTFGSIGLYVALYSVGAHQKRLRTVVAAAASAGYAVFVVVLIALRSPGGLTDYVIYYLAWAVVWGLGVLVGDRRAQEAERRRLAEQAAITAERSRIARELHDVVTHHVTAMVVQAGAAHYLTGSPDRLNEALDAINGTGRRALTELRFLLGVLEATGENSGAAAGKAAGRAAAGVEAPAGALETHQERTPLPGRVSDLVEQTRAGGQPVELVEDGEQAAMAIGARLAAYRVVQESLTNAVKYAAGRPTLVRLAHTEQWTDVEVTTAGADRAMPVSAALRDGGPHVSGGRGLTGLRERVEMLGGEFGAGPGLEGGFRVHARIPAGGVA